MLQSVFSERQREVYRPTGFMAAQTSAKDICEGMNVEAIYSTTTKRLRSTKWHFSCESFDEPLSDAL
jgi:hypothetical protein